MSHPQKLPLSKNYLLWTIAWAACFYSIALSLHDLYGYFTCFSNPLNDRCSSFSAADMIIIAVSLGFSLAGLICLLLKQPLIEILFFLMGSCAISSGILTSLKPDLSTRLFYFHLAILAPITLHFYMSLLTRLLRKVEWYSLMIVYLLGAGLAVPFILFPVSYLKQIGAYTFSATGVRIVFFIAVLWMILLLSYAYRHFSTLASRRKIRLLCLGSAFAFTPLLFLTLLPQTIGAAYASSALTFPWLLLIPLIYFYSIFRARLTVSEKVFSLSLVYYILIALILCIYFILIRIIKEAIPGYTIQLEDEGMILILLFFLFIPIRKSITHLVNWFLYGDETDYAVALRHLEKSLVNVLGLQELIDLLLGELVLTTKVRQAALFLKQNFQLVFVKSTWIKQDQLCDVRLTPDSMLYQYLSSLKAPVDTLRLRKDLAKQELSEQENFLIRFPGVALWLPFKAERDLQGLILLDTRIEDDLFTQADKDLLTDLIDHAGNAIRNVLMAEKLREGRNDLARAHKMLLEVQEQERKRIARELHDESIQKLIGVNYQIINLKKKAVKLTGAVNSAVIADDLDLIRNELLELITSIRELIGELRPVGLDALGLPVVLESYVEKIRESQGLISPIIEINIDQQLSWLPEYLSVCIFRVAQEAIRNSLKYAAASTIFVDLYATSERIVLKVMDDGQGFSIPDRLSEFSFSGHYGLTGMQERVEYVGGSVTISSDPGKGTEIIAIFPIQGTTNDSK